MQDNDARVSQGFGEEPQASDANDLKGQLGQKAQQAAEQARSVAERGKQKLAEGAEGVTTALRHASEGLRSDEQAELARYTSVVADKLEQLTGALKNRDVESLVSGITRFAKRQPALFLGGAFTTGLIAARFFKSSTSREGGVGASQSAFDRGPGTGMASTPTMGDARDDASLRDDVTSAGGYGPAPGGYGPASAPAGAHGGAGVFGAEGAGGGPGNDPSLADGQKGAAE